MAAKEKLSTESYKGVRDFYPEEQAFLNYFTSTIRRFVERVGYVQYGASILEPSEMYKAKGAENEEIINEETYTFVDRGGREVTLRPEMTPTVARMVAQRRREMGFPLRFYSIPNVFRYEKPQRGRLREHWQLNVDLFGSRSPYADAEIIGMAYGLMIAFGAKDSDFVIRVSSRAHINKICEELSLSDENSRKLLLLLDHKSKMSHEEFLQGLKELGVPEEAVSSHDTPADIQKMIEEFAAAGIANIVFDPSIVRGFNYYTGTVFEVYDTHEDNNRALFGGGRYDNLTALFDDEPTPGVGFGMGDVTIRNFLEVRGLVPPYLSPTHVYIAIPSPDLALQAQTLAGDLRRQGVNAAIDFGEKKLGDQIKTADKHKIPFVLVFGSDEISSGSYPVRELATGTERKLSKEELASFFLNTKK